MKVCLAKYLNIWVTYNQTSQISILPHSSNIITEKWTLAVTMLAYGKHDNCICSINLTLL